jgi:hypothetical protein
VAEHGGGGAVFFFGELDGAFNCGGLQVLAFQLVDELDVSEDFGFFARPFCFELNFARRDFFASLFQNHYDIECGAAAKPEEQHFHGPDTDVAAACFRRAIHDHRMARAAFAYKGAAIQPLNSCFHYNFSSSLHWGAKRQKNSRILQSQGSSSSGLCGCFEAGVFQKHDQAESRGQGKSAEPKGKAGGLVAAIQPNSHGAMMRGAPAIMDMKPRLRRGWPAFGLLPC